MSDITKEDITTLSSAIADLRRDIDVRFATVDAKLDAKPGYGAMVATLAFGIGAVITSTIVVLKTTGVAFH